MQNHVISFLQRVTGILRTDYWIHVVRGDQGVASVMITVLGYDPDLANHCLNELLKQFCAKYPPKVIDSTDSFSLPELESSLEKYNRSEDDPTIDLIKKELDETKKVLEDTIQKVLDRGDNINDLVDRTGHLSEQSKTFYRTAKAQNSCCQIM